MYKINKDNLEFKKGENIYQIADLLNNDKSKDFDFSACIRRLKAGDSSQKHSHKNSEELIYILSGTGILSIEDETSQIKKGDFIVIPKESPHFIENDGDEQIEIIAIGLTGNLYDGWNTWF